MYRGCDDGFSKKIKSSVKTYQQKVKPIDAEIENSEPIVINIQLDNED